MKPSEDQHSVSESGVAGGFFPHSQEYKEPPQVCFEQKNAGDLPKSTETWSDDHLPIDIMLLTVESCDFLNCSSLLDKPFKSYKKEIGYVYFGGIGDTSDQEKLKIALVKCGKGAATPGGSLTAVLNAVRVLRPKAAFSVGTCISLGLENVKMGDVVISCKLTAEGFRTPVSPLLSPLIQDAPYGWVAPLQNPDEMKVKVHCDGDILSQSLRDKCRCDDVFERYPGAVAIETEGEGLYAAAYDANIEWVIVKGVASYFHQSQSATSEWMSFASTMAASMVAKMLKDPTVFREWPHYNQGVRYGTSEDQHSLRCHGVAQEYLVTQKMKEELKLETNCLKTIIHKENYLNCKKALMELPSTYSGNITRNPNMAIPLCLPNNCRWDATTGRCSETGERRSSLVIVDEALQKLSTLKGPVCVVSIAGPYRKGKSYILSKAFDQGVVFPLGHCLEPETMGIWMWVVPEKIKDTDSQEFTVVLLDSEGIDDVTADGSDDHCIFTLTILLASVLIYNSDGVPSRNYLDGLDVFARLPQRIQLRSTDQPGKKYHEEDSKLFFKTFPYFIWLVRDVGLPLPKDCNTIKDFFLTRVFKSEPCSQDDKAGKVAESILNFFPGFEAFKLRPPSSDPEVRMNLNREEFQHNINKSFIREVQEFKVMLFSKLSPKRSFQDGVYVTGEALASLVNTYVAALNTPGMVPSVQSAWETFVHTKCTEAKCAAVQVYDKAMSTQLDKCQLPCDSDDIRKIQKDAVEKSMVVFEAKTVGVSALNSEKYLEELKEYTEKKLKALQQRNSNLTREECLALLKRLKKERLHPILALLPTEGGSSVRFAEIIGGYSAIEEGFKSQSRGAKDVCAQVFYEFHPQLQKDMQKHLTNLQQLKDYDQILAQKREELARHEQERKRTEEERKRLEDEQKTREREIKLLQEKREEDRRRLEEQFRADMQSQREQRKDMMTANMDELLSKRQAMIDQNQTLQDTIRSMNEAMERRNAQMLELQNQLTELANHPPPSPPSGDGGCVIL
ncbi:guanylate-binding protein 1-like isoform X3 [Acropora muricata]